MNYNRIKELEGMIEFADELLEEYEEHDEKVPEFVYEKIISVHEELIELIKEDTKRLEMATEVTKAANKVFENKGV